MGQKYNPSAEAAFRPVPAIPGYACTLVEPLEPSCPWLDWQVLGREGDILHYGKIYLCGKNISHTYLDEIHLINYITIRPVQDWGSAIIHFEEVFS